MYCYTYEEVVKAYSLAGLSSNNIKQQYGLHGSALLDNT